MPRTSIISITITCWVISDYAQAQPELDVAIKAGLNAATQAENLRVNKYGFSGGISGNIHWLTTSWSSLGIQTELIYSPRGANVVLQGEQIGTIRDNYLDLTLTIRPEIYLGWGSIYLLLGGGINYLTNATKDDSAGSGQDITDGLHRFDVSVLGAAGIALYLPRKEAGPFHLGTVFLEARHDVGLLDVDLMGGFKNRTSSLMLGLSFVVGGSPTPAASTTSKSASRLGGRST